VLLFLFSFQCVTVLWVVVAQLDPCKCTCTQKAAGRGGGITWIGCRDTMMHARRVLI